MQIQINKNLQDCTENVAFGLTFRQALCSGIGLALGLGGYFLATKKLGLSSDTASWIVIVTVVPFGALGFVQYNGMPFERLVKAWLKQYFFCSQKLRYKQCNLDYEKDKVLIDEARCKEAKNNDKNN